MHIVSFASPDKLSLNTSLLFIKSCLGNDYVLGSMHSFMMESDILLYIDSLMGKSEKLIFSFYAKGKINKDPLIVIPKRLQEVSSLLVWMDLYSMEWRVIKDLDSVSAGYIDRWNRNLQRMGGGT